MPPGVTYDSNTRTLSGTPSKVGEYLIPYKATFPEMADSPVAGGHIKINVRPLPVSINVTDKEQTIRLGEAIKNMVVSHSEHSDLGARYLSVDLPEGDIDSYLESTAGLNYNAATHTISGTPTKPGVYKVRLKATIDSETLGKGSAEEIITVTVVDDPVSLDIKNDRQMIVLGKTSLRPITFTVPDGVTLTVDTTKLPNGVTYDESAKTISGTPTVAGAFDIPVTVTSAGGKSLTKDITIDVVDLTSPTPTVTVKENNDGTHTITITQPNGQPVETIIKNGKDGETPKVKVDRDETKKETTLTFYSDKNANNQFDEGTDTVLGTSVIKDGQDGVAGPKGDKGDQGLQGRDGQNGTNGRDGIDGKSPTITTNENQDGSHTIVITNPDGTKQEIIVKNGKDGRNGRDGVDGKSPTIITNENQDGSHTIIIINPDGSKREIVVKNGKDGKDGRDGKDGKCTCGDTPKSPRENKPEEPKGDSPTPPREDKPQEPKGDTPKPPREDKPQEPKDDKPQEPKGDIPELPREDKPGKDTPVNVVAVPVPSETTTEVSGLDSSEQTSQGRTTLPNTGSQTDVISILLGSGILLTLYVAKRKED